MRPADHRQAGVAYAELATALKDTTGIDIGFLPTGIATLALEESEATALRQRVASQRQAGLRCDAGVRAVGGRALPPAPMSSATTGTA